MLDMQAAIQKAEEFLQSVYGKVFNLVVEEVVPPDEASVSKAWLVTFSFINSATTEKTFKEFEVDAESGKVRGMFMRHVR
jgi:hypothetical protein